MSTTKILLITVRSDFGGGPRHIHQLIENLPPEVTIYLACPKGEPYGSLWRNKKHIVDIYDIPHRKFSIFKLACLKKFIKKNQINIVHSHGNGAGFYSRCLKIIYPKIKVIHTFHGLTVNYESKIKKNINILFVRLFKHLTDQFILVSNGEFELARKIKAININCAHIVYNGIETPDETAEFLSDTFDVITLSRFDYQKNMDMAYEIATNFKENKNIRFIWVGDGEDFERLKLKSENEGINIIFIGFSTNPIEFLLSSSLYLSTARFEGLPYALIEAISVGLPVIATDVVGNNEVVSNNNNGYLFKTVQEGVELINKLYFNRPKLIDMSIQSRKKFKIAFTIDEMITKLVKIYKA